MKEENNKDLVRRYEIFNEYKDKLYYLPANYLEPDDDLYIFIAYEWSIASLTYIKDVVVNGVNHEEALDQYKTTTSFFGREAFMEGINGR